MNEIAKFVIVIGIVLVVIGLGMLFLPKIPFLGRLPGDIIIKRDNFTFYFPLATSVILSIILTIILYLMGKR
jgi:uncharacterized membrane protein HdeD (DUF308 family)